MGSNTEASLWYGRMKIALTLAQTFLIGFTDFQVDETFVTRDLNMIILKLSGLTNFVSMYELSSNYLGIYVEDEYAAERKVRKRLWILVCSSIFAIPVALLLSSPLLIFDRRYVTWNDSAKLNPQEEGEKSGPLRPICLLIAVTIRSSILTAGSKKSISRVTTFPSKTVQCAGSCSLKPVEKISDAAG